MIAVIGSKQGITNPQENAAYNASKAAVKADGAFELGFEGDEDRGAFVGAWIDFTGPVRVFLRRKIRILLTTST